MNSSNEMPDILQAVLDYDLSAKHEFAEGTVQESFASISFVSDPMSPALHFAFVKEAHIRELIDAVVDVDGHRSLCVFVEPTPCNSESLVDVIVARDRPRSLRSALDAKPKAVSKITRKAA